MPEVRRYFHQDRINYPRGTPCQRRFRKITSLVGDPRTFPAQPSQFLNTRRSLELAKRTPVQWLVYSCIYVIIGLISKF